MKASLLKSVLVAIVVSVAYSSTAKAQENQGGGMVAVLDVARVFKENKRFEQRMAAIKQEAEKLKQEVGSQQEKIQSDAQRIMATYTANAPERKTAEADLEQQLTKLRTYARQSESDLLAKEATVYHDTYVEMQTGLAKLIADNKWPISLVLRFDSSPIDRENRGDVIKGVNRAVVYQNNLDLTDHVIAAMNGGGTSANAGQPLK